MGDLSEQLPVSRIRLGLPAATRRDVLSELARLLGGRDDAVREAVLDDLVSREQMSSTGVGGGIAFPHARVDSLPAIRLAFVRTGKPVEFDALDGAPVDLFLGIAGPSQDRREYLAALAGISYLFRSEEVREELRRAPEPPAVREVLREFAAGDRPPPPDAPPATG